MDKHKASLESDDDVLNKLDALLYRYKNQIIKTDGVDDALSSHQDAVAITETALSKNAPLFDDAIPLLTDVVLLQPTKVQTHAGHSLSLQQVLDAALGEAEIEMNASDRIMLTKALKKRLFRV